MTRTKLTAAAIVAVATGAMLAGPAGAENRPLTKADCKGGGQYVAAYKNHGDCVSASNHGAVVESPDGTGIIDNHNETVLVVVESGR